MPQQTRTVLPGPNGRCVRTAAGEVLYPPEGWVLVPPGDPGLTRRIKAAGPSWTVQEKKGRKLFSRGVWALGTVVDGIRTELTTERSTPQYARRRVADSRRRDHEQSEYVHTFHQTVLEFLAFAPPYAELAAKLAHAVTVHATPVGSGTVARTERIPVAERAQAAVTAWMRHQTTAYDSMIIPRVKGKRREVRRMLAARSNEMLNAYRTGREVNHATCPLQRALAAPTTAGQ